MNIEKMKGERRVKTMAKALSRDWINDFWKQNGMEPKKILFREIKAHNDGYKWDVILQANFPETLMLEYEYWPEYDKGTLTPFYPIEKLSKTYSEKSEEQIVAEIREKEHDAYAENKSN